MIAPNWVRLSVLGAALLAGSAAAQEKAGKAAEPDAAVKALAEMMAAFEKYSSPGPAHKRLESLVGKWNASVKIWPEDGAPPLVTQGTAVNRPVLGGRFVMQEFSGEFLGKPFHGIGLEGYDAFKEKYTSVWVDTTSTAVLTLLGTCDPQGRECTYFGRADDVVSGERDRAVKEVVRFVGADTMVFETFDVHAGGKELRVMEITYTRASSPSPSE